jgi:hypothetical protein
MLVAMTVHDSIGIAASAPRIRPSETGLNARLVLRSLEHAQPAARLVG